MARANDAHATDDVDDDAPDLTRSASRGRVTFLTRDLEGGARASCMMVALLVSATTSLGISRATSAAALRETRRSECFSEGAPALRSSVWGLSLG